MELQILVIWRGASSQLGLWFEVLQSTMRMNIQLLYLGSWMSVAKHHMAIHHLHQFYHILSTWCVLQFWSNAKVRVTTAPIQYIHIVVSSTTKNNHASMTTLQASFTLTAWIESQLCTRTHDSLLTCSLERTYWMLQRILPWCLQDIWHPEHKVTSKWTGQLRATTNKGTFILHETR